MIKLAGRSGDPSGIHSESVGTSYPLVTNYTSLSLNKSHYEIANTKRNPKESKRMRNKQCSCKVNRKSR